MSLSLVYVTAPTRTLALEITRNLLEERLVACGNVFDTVTSMYRWEGDVQEDQETILILKTRTNLASQVIKRVRQLHSYDVPCVVAYESIDADAEYADWVANETSAD